MREACAWRFSVSSADFRAFREPWGEDERSRPASGRLGASFPVQNGWRWPQQGALRRFTGRFSKNQTQPGWAFDVCPGGHRGPSPEGTRRRFKRQGEAASVSGRAKY